MPSHRSDISDEQLLALIHTGVIKLKRVFDAHPELYVNGRLVKAELNEQGGRRRIYGGKRYRWSIRYRGKRRRIVRAKLVWMYVHLEIIPLGYVIHHGPLGSLNDSIENISKVSDADHSEIHYGNRDARDAEALRSARSSIDGDW